MTGDEGNDYRISRETCYLRSVHLFVIYLKKHSSVVIVQSEIVIEKVVKSSSRIFVNMYYVCICVLKSDEERHVMNNRIKWIVATVENLLLLSQRLQQLLHNKLCAGIPYIISNSHFILTFALIEFQSTISIHIVYLLLWQRRVATVITGS